MKKLLPVVFLLSLFADDKKPSIEPVKLTAEEYLTLQNFNLQLTVINLKYNIANYETEAVAVRKLQTAKLLEICQKVSATLDNCQIDETTKIVSKKLAPTKK
jgi:hypothetical protein